MRTVCPRGAGVLWYDAVTVEGRLDWQNTLNRLNRPFLDACDAIWINYTWKEGTPAEVQAQVGAAACYHPESRPHQHLYLSLGPHFSAPGRSH